MKGNVMKRANLPLYAVALSILVVGLAFAGVPISTLLLGLVVLACPLMMMFMMGGGHGGSDQHTNGSAAHDDRDQRPTSGHH
jgi:hypothetical protein